MKKVFTWNTQGNFQTGVKRATLQALLNECDVGMVQEGGGNVLRERFRVKRKKVRYSMGSAPGAKNTRCTNWAFSRWNGDAWKSKTIGGGDAGRQAAGLHIGGILFVSWHSYAVAENDADTSALFREIVDEVLGPGHATLALVGGDFNTPLPNLILVANSVTSGRMRGGFDNTIFHSGQATHRSGKSLDYFVLLYRGEPRIYDYRINVRRVPVSDHDPVILEFDEDQEF